MWRGKIKRWSTNWHMTDSVHTSNLHSAFLAAGWPNPGDTTGDCSGGLASIAVYNGSGGAPISNTIYFDWQTPSTWIPYTGTAWSGVDADTPIDASGESAMVLVGHMAGLSASGKPVTTRKYLHAIPSRTAADYADPDIDATSLASLESTFFASWMANPAGVTPTSISVDEWYGNHQRVRGRRRTTSQVAQQSFSAGVMAGAGAATSEANNFQ